MHIDKCERREHIATSNANDVVAIWLERDLGPGVKRIKNIRPCGVEIGKCWTVTYEVDDTRSTER